MLLSTPHPSTRTRVALLALVAAGGLVLLAGCAPSAEPSASPSSSATPAAAGCTLEEGGDAVESVSVSGEFGAPPTTTFAAPLSVEATEYTTLIAGEGENIDGLTAIVEVQLLNGSTGEEATSTGFGAGGELSLAVSADRLFPGLYATLACASVGDRVVSVVPAAEAYGEAGYADLGIGAGDSIVLVVDIVGVLATRATGEAQPAPDGFPAVTLAEDGAPTVEIPDSDPPADLRIATLILGDGSVVADGDQVTVQYQGINWRTKEIFDQSWGSAPATFGTGQVIEGFGAALVGQTVGSQVIVIIPPDQGYGPQGGNSGAGIEADDTLVFVVDILATSSAG